MGDLDLFVAQHFDPGSIIYFENTGTVSVPAFIQNDPANPFNGMTIGDDPNAALGDIDNDGDLDFIVGD